MFKLPQLQYSYDALEPYIDAQTMELHYSKHHATYVEKLNKALENHESLAKKSLEELLSSLESLPEEIRKDVRNHGGGHYNHSLFWGLLKKSGEGEAIGTSAFAIKEKFGNFNGFKDEFTKKAAGIFGSGWAWLVLNKAGELELTATGMQDTPIMTGLTPLLGLDVWEHAYYLKYQNRRPEYIAAWWNVINWDKVENLFEAARG